MSLEASIAALRETGASTDGTLAATTRARVQRSLARRATRRRRLVQSTLVVSVLLVSTLSWAWSTGRLPLPFRSAPEAAPEVTPEPTTAIEQVVAKPARVQVAPAPAPEQPAATEALYRAAHEAHFRGGDPAKALAAWDAYLAAEASGRFAIEARYNRALVLARLGRYADARTALAPFAAGEIENGYRRDEANKLVERIDEITVNGSAGSGD